MKQVRRADLRDAEAIAQIHVGTWQQAYRGIIPDSFLDGLSVAKRLEFWRPRLAAGAPGWTLVVEADSKIVGFADFGPSRDAAAAATTGELNALYVASDYWRTGCGRLLWMEAERALVSAGFGMVTLWVLAENRRGRNFYERRGFNFDGASKEISFSGTILSEVRYSKILPKP